MSMATDVRLPWCRYLDDRGNPVVVMTPLGALLAGDDGNIFVSCMSGKAYAIEVNVRPEYSQKIQELVARRTPRIQFGDHVYTEAEFGAGWYDPAVVAMPGNLRQPSQQEILRPVLNFSKRGDRKVFLKTNLGLEAFDSVLAILDTAAWNSTEISLETLKEVLPGKLRFERELIYYAREIKLKQRGTDRFLSGDELVYSSRMAKPFKSEMDVCPVPAWYPTTWAASFSVVFIPSIASVDLDNGAEKDRWKRAVITAKHARENERMGRSECSWEFDAWRDVFCAIRDDPLLAMDKHEASFLEEIDLDERSKKRSNETFGKHMVRLHRIPDCTFGIAVAHAQKNQREENALLTSKGLLSNSCLNHLLWRHDTSLISDPEWASCALAFPWAVYEAKKAKNEVVLKQIQRSSEIYLNMLHDLVLVPGSPERRRPFQEGFNGRFQIFSMTSEGPKWKLYVCYRKMVSGEPGWMEDPSKVSTYDMKMIWEGNITNEHTAWQLHSLVDQIHSWAVKTFRPFVIASLEPCHKYAANLHKYTEKEPDHQKLEDLIRNNVPIEAFEAAFRIKMEIKAAEQSRDLLDIVDEEVSQLRHEELPRDGESALNRTLSSYLPWWARYQKPQVVRQRILKGQKHDAAGLAQLKKRQRTSVSPPRRRRRQRWTGNREKNKISQVYEERQKQQNEDLVLTPYS